jgi:hypothetical protein
MQQSPPSQESTVDAKELVSVYTVANSVEAQIIKNALQDEGIRAFIEGGNQAAEAGLVGLPIDIEVAAADADRARKFIEHHQHKRQYEHKKE